VSKKLRLLTFGSVNCASTAGGYAAVTKGLNGQHFGTDATWRINAKILTTCRRRRHIVSPRAQLVIRRILRH